MEQGRANPYSDSTPGGEDTADAPTPQSVGASMHTPSPTILDGKNYQIHQTVLQLAVANIDLRHLKPEDVGHRDCRVCYNPGPHLSPSHTRPRGYRSFGHYHSPPPISRGRNRGQEALGQLEMHCTLQARAELDTHLYAGAVGGPDFGIPGIGMPDFLLAFDPAHMVAEDLTMYVEGPATGVMHPEQGTIFGNLVLDNHQKNQKNHNVAAAPPDVVTAASAHKGNPSALPCRSLTMWKSERQPPPVAKSSTEASLPVSVEEDADAEGEEDPEMTVDTAIPAIIVTATTLSANTNTMDQDKTMNNITSLLGDI
ncbi:hypothetical protein HWV62_13160 [Athelia sp. TMB]|nr:hypothetical protein HWV62_13160 [Athelia sp. TMB]